MFENKENTGFMVVMAQVRNPPDSSAIYFEASHADQLMEISNFCLPFLSLHASLAEWISKKRNWGSCGLNSSKGEYSALERRAQMVSFIPR